MPHTIDELNLTICPQLSSRQSEANRIRKILLILLGILFTFDLIYLIFIVHTYIDHSWFSHYFKNNYELIWTLISVIYDAFGLLTTYQYYRAGLHVFAWIGTIFLILICIITGIILLAAFSSTKNVDVVDMNVTGPLIFMIIFIASAVFLLIIVIYSFKLLKLISNNRNTIIRSI